MTIKYGNDTLNSDKKFFELIKKHYFLNLCLEIDEDQIKKTYSEKKFNKFSTHILLEPLFHLRL